MDIKELSANLKLPFIRDNWQHIAAEMQQNGNGYEEFLANLLEAELHQRLENGQVRRIREAKFPIKKYLCDFDTSRYDDVFSPKFKELGTLRFIANKENIVLLGTSGAGKDT